MVEDSRRKRRKSLVARGSKLCMFRVPAVPSKMLPYMHGSLEKDLIFFLAPVRYYNVLKVFDLSPFNYA